MSRNTLSVVIPAYNEASTIESCLEALFAQIDDIAEIIVVDNNSSDDTAEAVRRVADTHRGHVVLLHESRQGIPPARNAGFDAARGTVLARIDADTRVQPGWARAIVDFFDAHGDVYEAGSGTCTAYDLPFQERFQAAQDTLTESVQAKLLAGKDVDAPRLFGSNMTLTASAWRRIASRTSMRTDIFEDVDLTLCAQEVGVRCAIIPGARARISGRRYTSGVVSYVKYCWCDQRTFAIHGRPAERRAAVVTMLTVSLPFYAAMWLPFRAWEPSSETFRPGRLLRRHSGDAPEPRRALSTSSTTNR